jgi:hypothetical protein
MTLRTADTSEVIRRFTMLSSAMIHDYWNSL